MKSRYISIFLLSVLITVGMGSCKKQLDNQLPSDGSDEENIFSSLAGFEQATRGMYNRMVYAEHYIGGSDVPVSWISTMDLLADNLIIQQTGRGSQRFMANYQYVPSSNIATFDECYLIIRAANNIILNKDLLAGTENFYGEALAVRGMVHFDLLRLYSKPVSGPNADPNSLGIPYVTSTDITLMPNRGTVQDTYANIVADLVSSLDYINDDNGSGRLNKAAVYGLLSRVYLYGGEWNKCIEASTACLDLNGDPGSIEEFPKIWTDESENGVLFKVRFTEQNRGSDGLLMIGTAYNQTTGQGIKSEWVCTKSLFDLYKDSVDIRKSSYITTTTFGGAEYNAIIKYYVKGLDNSPLGLIDVKYLRVAEIILNRAEAYTKMSNDAAALEDLNSLRQNRYLGFVDGTETGTALQDAIALERRLELAFESDRWFELKRKGLPVERDEFGDFADGSGTPAAVTTLSTSDHRWQLPISQFDIQANPNLTQNFGY